MASDLRPAETANGPNGGETIAPPLANNRASEPQAPRPRPNVRACTACRQMKMKCEGGDNPPCVKCRKAGRECVPQPSHQTRYSLPPTSLPDPHRIYPPGGPNRVYGLGQPVLSNPPSHVSTPPRLPGHGALSSNSNGLPYQPSSVNNSTPQPQNARNASDVSSVYSVPPVDVASEGAQNNGYVHYQNSRKRKRSEVTSKSEGSPWNDGDLLMSKPDLRDMVYMFREKILPFMPAFQEKEFENIDHVIEKQLPLVHCICFVTAKFLPGGRETRKMLLPRIVQLLSSKYAGELDELSILKALYILYHHSEFPSAYQTSEVSEMEETLHWSMKSHIEMFALRFSLHNSVQDLRSEIRSKTTSKMHETKAYQRYCFWLQIFIMSHHYSVITGTRPSICLDSTLQAAPSLMRDISIHPQTRLVGEVELCLIWAKAGSQHHQVMEWWCRPDPSEIIDETATESIMTEVDRAIDAWYDKWWEYISDPNGRGALLDYLGRYARFCISSYAVRYVRKSPGGLSPLQNNQVQRCVTYANRMLDWLLNLGPMQKDRLRYVTDPSYVMISFCCLFVVASCEAFTSSISNPADCLDRVTAAAQLIKDLAMDKENRGYIHGSLILKRVQAVRETIEQKTQHENVSGSKGEVPQDPTKESVEQSSPEILQDGLDIPLGTFGTFDDTFWDFSTLQPW